MVRPDVGPGSSSVARIDVAAPIAPSLPHKIQLDDCERDHNARLSGSQVRHASERRGMTRHWAPLSSSLRSRQDARMTTPRGSGWGRSVVLKGVSLTATPGSTLAVLGRTGAGKITLFATLIGLTTIHGGTIRMGGRAIDALPTRKFGTGTLDCEFRPPLSAIMRRRTLFRDRYKGEYVNRSSG
jgi:ABC-type glutathione transport system ATPase component